jgi:hypothetical protein
MNWMKFWFPFEGDLALVRLTLELPGLNKRETWATGGSRGG